jgi:hypothetical protein
MKRIIFLTALMIVLVSIQKTYGQKSIPVKGSFEMPAKAGVAAVKAFYNVTEAANDNIVLQFVPDKPFKLNAHIVNNKGQEVQKINQQEVGLRYAESIDVSKLPAGDYFIEVLYGDNNEHNYRIPFTK